MKRVNWLAWFLLCLLVAGLNVDVFGQKSGRGFKRNSGKSKYKKVLKGDVESAGLSKGAKILPEVFLIDKSFRPTIEIPGIGLERIKNEKDFELLEFLKERYVRASWFGVLRQPTYGLVKNCETDYAKKLFEKVAKSEKGGFGVSPELLKALHAKESFCRNVRSPTGPLGWSQFARATARRYGLSSQDRLVPEKSVLAAYKHLQDLHEELEDLGLAFWGYHSGVGVPKKAKLLARQEGMGEPITMDKLMFLTSPVRYVKTYEFMREAYKTDYSITYYYGVLAMEQILRARKENAAWVDGLWLESQLALNQPEGGDLKYANRYEFFLDLHGVGKGLGSVRLVRKTNETQTLPDELKNLPDEATLGLYYYLAYKLNELEDSLLGKNSGTLGLVDWSRSDFEINLRTSAFRKTWVLELLRQLSMQEVLGFEQKEDSVKVTINPKMNVWGTALFMDNYPIFYQ